MDNTVSILFISFLVGLGHAAVVEPPPINCTRPNEHYECGSACQTECKTLGEVCPIVNIKCNEGCYCNEGYARNARGACIPVSRCPPKTTPIKCTKPHEHYECGSACQNECKTLGEVCPIVNVKCNEGCYCDKGYARDANGVCIPEKKCPPKPPPINCAQPNEHYECGSQCQNECKTLGQACPIVNKKCREGCYCNKGYARDPNWTCIPESECPLTPPLINCTNPHEHYSCGSACQNECRTLGEVCPIVNIRCNDACYCDDGYARDSKGICIPESKCPPKPPRPNCTNPHEHYECGSVCQTECATLGERCPVFSLRCNDAKGVCIPQEKCPPKPPKPNCTEPHEHCECGSACQNECSTLGEECPIKNIKCNDGCYCDEGYARDADGVCVPEEECPPKKRRCPKKGSAYDLDLD